MSEEYGSRDLKRDNEAFDVFRKAIGAKVVCCIYLVDVGNNEEQLRCISTKMTRFEKIGFIETAKIEMSTTDPTAHMTFDSKERHH